MENSLWQMLDKIISSKWTITIIIAFWRLLENTNCNYAIRKFLLELNQFKEFTIPLKLRALSLWQILSSGINFETEIVVYPSNNSFTAIIFDYNLIISSLERDSRKKDVNLIKNYREKVF